WLLAGRTRHDTRYRACQRPVRDLIRRLDFEAGVHPSFRAAARAEMLVAETRALADATGRPIRKCRMHFLRYRLPDTYRAMLRAQIEEDYTTCMPALAGFKYGTARPFRWFDVEADEPTPLTLVPTLWMDRTFLSYEKLTPDTARVRAQSLMQRAKKTGGRAAFLLHPAALIGADEWKGWESWAHGVWN
ncbi:MAG: hypothetical protein RMM53_02005, partial [Bacteroidia bacterium]|nr:hypothetical protein [Bacteroidia bacterium]